MFKGLGNIASLLRQANQMGDKLGEVSNELKAKRATGSAGGGLVEVEVNGLGQVLKVHIDPMLVEQGEREMIQDLLPAAFNQASAKAKQMHVEVMSQLTGGLSIPGLDDLMNQAMGQSPSADELERQLTDEFAKDMVGDDDSADAESFGAQNTPPSPGTNDEGSTEKDG